SVTVARLRPPPLRPELPPPRSTDPAHRLAHPAAAGSDTTASGGLMEDAMETPRQTSILALRERLGSPPPRRLLPSDLRQAAVLVPLYVDAGELWTGPTKRSDTLHHHRAQLDT